MSFIGYFRFREIVFYLIIWKVILSWHKTVTYPPIFLLQTKIDYYYLVAAPAALSSRVADLNCFENCLPFISFQAVRMKYAKKCRYFANCSCLFWIVVGKGEFYFIDEHAFSPILNSIKKTKLRIKLFTSRVAAWSCRTVGRKKRK